MSNQASAGGDAAVTSEEMIRLLVGGQKFEIEKAHLRNSGYFKAVFDGNIKVCTFLCGI